MTISKKKKKEKRLVLSDIRIYFRYIIIKIMWLGSRTE